MLQGAIILAQQCHSRHAPNFLQRVIRGAQKCRMLSTLKGAIMTTQKCQNPNAPASFIWCQTDGAEMPWTNRTKGRVMDASQQCHIARALPTQFNGVIVKTQKCLNIVAPREGSMSVRRNAMLWTPFPTSLTGTLT